MTERERGNEEPSAGAAKAKASVASSGCLRPGGVFSGRAFCPVSLSVRKRPWRSRECSRH